LGIGGKQRVPPDLDVWTIEVAIEVYEEMLRKKREAEDEDS
jgi:hypothetical protein